MKTARRQPIPWRQLLLVEAILLCATALWLQGDLWYDEVMSLNLVLQHDSAWTIFRDYRFANNHFLSNVLEWLWLHGLKLNAASELVVRLPHLLCGMGTVAVVLLAWRRFLGERMALMTALLTACSPVFTAFAWQYRGYSLAMLLSALAVCAYAARSIQPTTFNGLALFLTGLALPLVMPPAAMLPCALALALLLGRLDLRCRKGLWEGVRAALPAAAGAFLGVAYYLTLWEQFQAASRESGGWTNAWLVALHVLFAFALHLGILGLPVLFALIRRRLPRLAETAAQEPPCTQTTVKAEAGMWLLAACLSALVAVLLLPSPVHRSPFPRVFLPLLPAVTFGAALLAREWPWLAALPPRPFRHLLAGCLLFALLLRQGSEALTSWQLDHAAEPPQNLLQQYYRGNNGVTLLLNQLADSMGEATQPQLLLMDPYDVPTCTFTWRLLEMAEYGPGNLPLKLPANLATSERLAPYQAAGYGFLILTRREADALRWAKNCGFPQPEVALVGEASAHHGLYRISSR